MAKLQMWSFVLMSYICAVPGSASSKYTESNEMGRYYTLYITREARSRDQPVVGESDMNTSSELEGGGKSDNSVLQRHLDRIRNMAKERRKEEMISVLDSVFGAGEKQDLPEYTESLPGTWDRDSRELSVQKHLSICHLERRIVNLNTLEYEHRPAYYEEVICANKYPSGDEVCSSLGFTCLQWNKTLHLTRRRYSSDCWEAKTIIIPAGCECMWPIHKLGDNIKLHV